MRNSHRFIAFALSVSLMLSVFSVCSSGSECCTLETNDFDEYCSLLSAMTAKYKPSHGTRADEKAACSCDDFSLKRVIVKSSVSALDLSGFGAVESIKGPDGLYILQFDSESQARNCVTELNASPLVSYAEPDIPVSICEGEADVSCSGSDTDTHLSWGPGYMKTDIYEDYLFNNGWSSSSVTVAVVDSGTSNHSFLRSKILSGGKDFVDDDDDPTNDGNGHGTHVSGIIADCTQKLNVMLLPVRVLDDNGESTSAMVSAGIRYAVDHGADIINYSITGAHSQTKDNAILYAIGKGVTVVCAAGNQKSDIMSYCPSHISEAIVVGAINESGERCSFSNYGASLDVVAPGYAITSCLPGDGYGTKNGTSMATPFVAAAAAMYKMYYPAATPANVEAFIKESARDLGVSGIDAYYGCGVPVLSSAALNSDYTYVVTPNGDAVITRYTGNATTISVPSVLGGHAVTEIGKAAFADTTSITEIRLPFSLLSIGDDAFSGCTSLESADISDSVISIGSRAFFNCPLLLTVRIHALMQTIGSQAFGVGDNGDVDGFTIEGYSGTFGKVYAESCGLNFIESSRIQIVPDTDLFYLVSKFSDLPSYTIYPKGANGIISQWQSSNEEVIGIVDGYPLGKSSGDAYLILSASNGAGNTASAKFRVRVIPAAFTLNNTNLSLNFKDTSVLKATVLLPGYSALNITFSSDNPEVARVTSSGTITAAKRGNATVKAVSADGKYTASCNVTVEYTPLQWFIKIFLFGWIWYKA